MSYSSSSRRHALASLVCVSSLLLGVSGFAPSTLSRQTVQLQQPQQQQQQQPLALFQSPLLSKRSTATMTNTPDARRSSSSLSAVAEPALALAAITGAITGGFFSGGLHAIAGPDHLAALLPRCCGQRWYRAGRVGALWGIGHGVSATIIGVLAFALKSCFNSNTSNVSVRLQTFLAGASHITEIAVGLSLVVIGLMGIREAREWKEEIDGVQPQSLSAAAADAGVKSVQKRAVIFNGLLHGFSWDGAPSLAPAIAVATWSGNLAFLSAYALGTMSTMAIATTLIGEGTRRAGDIFKRPDIPQKLSYFSSILAIAIGVVWCGLAVV